MLGVVCLQAATVSFQSFTSNVCDAGKVTVTQIVDQCLIINDDTMGSSSLFGNMGGAGAWCTSDTVVTTGVLEPECTSKFALQLVLPWYVGDQAVLNTCHLTSCGRLVGVCVAGLMQSIKSAHKIPRRFGISLLRFDIQLAFQVHGSLVCCKCLYRRGGCPVQVTCRGLQVYTRGLLHQDC